MKHKVSKIIEEMGEDDETSEKSRPGLFRNDEPNRAEVLKALSKKNGHIEPRIRSKPEQTKTRRALRSEGFFESPGKL